MNELKHWLDEASEADEFERSILRAGLEADPPEAKRDQIWSELMATLAVSSLAAATPSAQAAGAKVTAAGVKAAAVWFAVAKGFVVGLAIYGAAAGVAEISDRLGTRPGPAVSLPRAMARARATSSDAVALTATSAPPGSPTNEDVPSPPRTPQRGSVSAKIRAYEAVNPDAELPSLAKLGDSEQPSGARVSQLEAEARALRRARDELRAGKLADAFATLEASQRQFSAPELYQEREALMIELLDRSGQASTAEQRARAFLNRFPESPHAQQVRRFIAK